MTIRPVIRGTTEGAQDQGYLNLVDTCRKTYSFDALASAERHPDLLLVLKAP
jgi:hypothetical protein